ncbi:hypothetical protein [Piscirickettsia salmonis]|uniref:hypothetical protein n=1 Tax=Piscirickettsia salmonis TaxID=1238 RepID=UPI0007C8D38C|nr:hypothetical protein A0O36_02093 [Piscirickettsiaceae bacterium NZ-RLO1]
MPRDDQIRDQYLIHLKDACLNINDSVHYRCSISYQGIFVGFKKVSKFFLDGDIEKRYQHLKKQLKKAASTEERDRLCNNFKSFCFAKTGCDFDVRRLVNFSESCGFMGKDFQEVILLNGIHFRAFTSLSESFAPELTAAMEAVAATGNPEPYHLLQDNLKKIANDQLNKVNFQTHAVTFLRLKELGLDDLPICIHALLHNPDLINKLNQYAECLAAVRNKLDETYALIHKRSLGETRAAGLERNYPYYKAKMLESSCKFCLSTSPNIEHMKSEFSQHENELLSASGLADDRSGFGKFFRMTMRLLSNVLLLAVGNAISYRTNKHKKNMSTMDKLFPFFRQTASAGQVVKSAGEISHSLMVKPL